MGLNHLCDFVNYTGSLPSPRNICKKINFDDSYNSIKKLIFAKA